MTEDKRIREPVMSTPLNWHLDPFNRSPWLFRGAILAAAVLFFFGVWFFWSVNQYWRKFDALKSTDIGEFTVYKEEESVVIESSLALEIFTVFQEGERSHHKCNSHESYQLAFSVGQKMYFAELRFTRDGEMVANFSSRLGQGWDYGDKIVPSETEGKIRDLFVTPGANE